MIGVGIECTNQYSGTSMEPSQTVVCFQKGRKRNIRLASLEGPRDQQLKSTWEDSLGSLPTCNHCPLPRSGDKIRFHQTSAFLGTHHPLGGLNWRDRERKRDKYAWLISECLSNDWKDRCEPGFPGYIPQWTLGLLQIRGLHPRRANRIIFEAGEDPAVVWICRVGKVEKWETWE